MTQNSVRLLNVVQNHNYWLFFAVPSLYDFLLLITEGDVLKKVHPAHLHATKVNEYGGWWAPKIRKIPYVYDTWKDIEPDLMSVISNFHWFLIPENVVYSSQIILWYICDDSLLKQNSQIQKTAARTYCKVTLFVFHGRKSFKVWKVNQCSFINNNLLL